MPSRAAWAAHETPWLPVDVVNTPGAPAARAIAAAIMWNRSLCEPVGFRDSSFRRVTGSPWTPTSGVAVRPRSVSDPAGSAIRHRASAG